MAVALCIAPRRVRPSHRVVPVLLVSSCCLAGVAAAQTTVVFDAPSSGVCADTTIRGGGYAAVNYSTSDMLESKVSSESTTRRILLKFDTENHIPAGAVINSARLSLVLKEAADTTPRPIGAYRVAQSFSGPQVNWLDKDNASRWWSSGGDLGEKYTTSNVANAVGSTYTFDLTPLVQRSVNGDFGSRYTRVALVDTGGISSTSYRSFHSSRASNAALRPKLVVSYGSALLSSGTGTTLRVMQWNIHKGRNSNGTYDPNTDADWIVRSNADVVSINEMSYYLANSGNEDTTARLQSLLQQKTGKTWYKVFVNVQGGSWGYGNAMLSRLRPTTTAVYMLSYQRAVVRMGVMVNGIEVNVFSTHVDYDNSSYRTIQINQARSWISTFAKPRIVMGDFNTSPGTSDYNLLAADYSDSWVQAKNGGTATAYNGTGATHGSSRFDYIWNRGTQLTLKSVSVPDTRTAGVYASDHDPVLAVFTVQ
jgi:endonuclease/exonuclease/phosphatase family metal-dependent hydrolase